MTVCPIAIAIGCSKCPVVAVCPLKGVIGDFRKEGDAPPKATPGKAKGGAKKRA